MSRKQFVESEGATCDNWYWSWSFINRRERFVIFGVWDEWKDELDEGKIFSEDWQLNPVGERSKGYAQSREHIRLIEEEGYRLKTFAMQAKGGTWKEGVVPKIKSFRRELTERTLKKIGKSWYAVDSEVPDPIPEELSAAQAFPEGARHRVTINAYERNRKARAACIAHHGYLCAVCRFDFEKGYGDLGKEFIHVHHTTPIGQVGKEYELNPITDLVPICPNCHAIIHRTKTPLAVDRLRRIFEEVNRTRSV
jgi:5-methylcytosine-specific restriction protein A